jgi:DDE superfamily endonuclease
VLHNVGVSLQKARVVSAHLDAAQRLAWRQAQGPALVRAAKRGQGVILFAEEASVAPWGSLRYPWARRGPQPEGPPSGKRKGSKVFGAIASFSGRLFSPGLEGRFNAERDQAFWQRIMAQTTEPWCLSHDGAREHTSASTTAFWAAHKARSTEYPWPSYGAG